MDHFAYRQGDYHCEGVALKAIAAKVGTPTYIYSLATLRHHALQVIEAFQGEAKVCYAVKANGNLAVLKALHDLGCGFDLVSAGELFRVLKATGDPSGCVFAGVGKTDDEIRQAMQAGIHMFNIESLEEAAQLNALAGKAGRRLKVDFRLNPDVDAHTHRHITTGKKGSKFGLPLSEAPAIWRRAKALKNLQVTGIHLHIGSQITQVKPFVLALRRAVDMALRLRGLGHAVETLNLGGGLGIIYDRERPASPAEFAAQVRPALKGSGLKLYLEPGRYIVGNAGVLLTRTTFVKPAGGKRFVIVDAAMNDLIRPSLYEAYHEILPARKSAAARAKVDVVGPICESGDFLARDRGLPLPERGDLLVVRSAGAYGFAMSSNYNARPRAAEVLVDGKRWAVVRERESQDDLVRGERIPVWLR